MMNDNDSEIKVKQQLCEALGFNPNEVQSINLVIEPTSPAHAIIKILIEAKHLTKLASIINREDCHTDKHGINHPMRF